MTIQYHYLKMYFPLSSSLFPPSLYLFPFPIPLTHILLFTFTISHFQFLSLSITFILTQFFFYQIHYFIHLHFFSHNHFYFLFFSSLLALQHCIFNFLIYLSSLSFYFFSMAESIISKVQVNNTPVHVILLWNLCKLQCISS